MVAAPLIQIEKYFIKKSIMHINKSKLNLDCSYPFPIDFTPNGCLFGAISI